MSMKKKLISLFICIQMILSVIPPCFTISAGSEPSTIPAPVDTVEPGVTVKSIFPESQLTWKPYREHLKEQAIAAYENPERYIGYEAGFISSWQSANCRAEFESDVADVFISISDESTDYKYVDPDIKFIIDDYYFDESTSYLWYKVKAAEGHTLPQVLIDNPYILYVDSYITSEDGVDAVPPTFYIGPQKAMFLSDVETVLFKDNAGADFSFTEVSVSDLPAIFDVTPAHHFDNYGYTRWDNYYLGDIASEYTEYGYVSASSIVFIPIETSIVYENLLNAKDTYEYYDILSKAPTSVLAQLSDAHKAQLDICIEALDSLEHVTYETTVSVGDVTVPVSVVGKLPDNVTLTAEAVSADTVISEGFDVKDASEIITALDIKLINNEDGTEWQPEEGRRVGVSIGVGALGYEDGTVVKLQHKHDDFIETYDVMVVEDGAVTVYTSGFSIYAVNTIGSTTRVTGEPTIANNGTITLVAGQHAIYYCNTAPNDSICAWHVVDNTGALYYTVHTNSNVDANHNGMNARWIEIHALRETLGQPVQLIVYYRNNRNQMVTETYNLTVVAPQADAGGKKLYIKDMVNTTGSIFAALVDENGVEIPDGLAGAAFSWTRDDGVFIVPAAYGEGYASVNIARDHGGLTEARRSNGGFLTYHLVATLSSGEELKADYTVYYQSEIINANFESPKTANTNYAYFPNGYPNLYWKTTAPGALREDNPSSYISMDIEYGKLTYNDTDWGISSPADGTQFAELNCEDFGALYQDIITAPGENIDWEFAHAPRCNQDWSNPVIRVTNAMYIIIGPTESAQALDADELVELQEAAIDASESLNQSDRQKFESGQTYVKTTYQGATYWVWYHDAGGNYNSNSTNLPWTVLKGEYEVPEGQYRTRVFFASEPNTLDNRALNAGNLIDKTKAGQYKSYLIEYYEQTYEDGELVVKRVDEYEESGEALIYSSVKLKNYYEHFVQEEHDYLHHVEINGDNYPYDIRYSSTDPNNAYLYIESYPGEPKDHMNGGKDYSEYDIVMQIFMRDTVVAVQKQLVFPQLRNEEGQLIDKNGNLLPAGAKPVELLSEEQKLNLMNYFNTLNPQGYESQFRLYSPDTGYTYDEIGETYVTHRDPSGNYKAFVALGENPELGHTYIIEETQNTIIPGLELDSVRFQVQLYQAGQKWDELKEASYLEIEVGSGNPLLSPEFILQGDVKIADVVVINTYREKETVIYYQGVGNGKIKLNKTGATFEDTPSETLAFYSGKAIGCETHAGAGATFVGWYKDEACTDPVTAADGVWDKETGIFKPNANIINAETVTFYAKFETGSITINRENANPEQTFVYHIESTDGTVDMYVSLQCDENGKGSVEILEVPLQKTYTVTEIEDWSWRHPGSQQSGTNGETDDKRHLVFNFTSGIDKNKWLNGLSPEKENVFN